MLSLVRSPTRARVPLDCAGVECLRPEYLEAGGPPSPRVELLPSVRTHAPPSDIALDLLSRIYRANQEVIDQLAAAHDTVAVSEHAAPSCPYTQAKVLDVAGFALGEQLLAEPEHPDETH
jgi:hypothetical protein